jgi:hypothetical protein
MCKLNSAQLIILSILTILWIFGVASILAAKLQNQCDFMTFLLTRFLVQVNFVYFLSFVALLVLRILQVNKIESPTDDALIKFEI